MILNRDILYISVNLRYTNKKTQVVTGKLADLNARRPFVFSLAVVVVVGGLPSTRFGGLKYYFLPSRKENGVTRFKCKRNLSLTRLKARKTLYFNAPKGNGGGNSF